MIKTLTLSIIILTKNRSRLLNLCLRSFWNQMKSGDNIILVNNGSTDDTVNVIRSHKEKLPIRAYLVDIRGYPALYNFALKRCCNDIVVFCDDDCNVDKNYVSTIRKSQTYHKKCIVQGMTYSIPKGNIYADIMGDHYQNWLAANRLPDGSLRTFDNKNASLRRNLLTRYGNFSEKLVNGSEDIELGIRLRSYRVKIIFDPTIIAYHYERTTLLGFLRQHLRIAKSEAQVDKTFNYKNKISMFYFPKVYRHIKSALRRELNLLQNRRVKDFLTLPILYILLFIVRFVGYIYKIR